MELTAESFHKQIDKHLSLSLKEQEHHDKYLGLYFENIRVN